MSGRIFAVKQAIVENRNEQDRKYLERLEAELMICKEPEASQYRGDAGLSMQ